MASLETRIAKLEAKAGGKERGAVVALYEGEETREEALARAGVDPEKHTMTIFVRQWTKPEGGEVMGLINTFDIGR